MEVMMESKKKILLVDDEADFVELIKHRLEANDYQVTVAIDGKAALDTLGREKFDAVLLDILMPELDGIEVLKVIRKTDKQLPVFMLTAYSDKAKFKRANQLGASGYIVKTSDLQKEVENVTGILRLADKYKPCK
jgi:two-component system alkaline phosphatase synthesis response regulator PhoP